MHKTYGTEAVNHRIDSQSG